MEPKKELHSCDICGKGFQRDQAWDLRRHLYLVHGIGKASNSVVAIAENRRTKRDIFGMAAPRPKDLPTLHEVVHKNFAGKPEDIRKRRQPDIVDPEPKPAKPKPAGRKAITLGPEAKKPKTVTFVTEHEARPEDFAGMEETEKPNKEPMNLVNLVHEPEVQADEDIEMDKQFVDEESEAVGDEEYDGKEGDDGEKTELDLHEKFEKENYGENEKPETISIVASVPVKKEVSKPETRPLPESIIATVPAKKEVSKPETRPLPESIIATVPAKKEVSKPETRPLPESIIATVPAKKEVSKPETRPLPESILATVPPKKEVLKPEGKIITGTTALKKKVPKAFMKEPKSKKKAANKKVDVKKEVPKYPKGKSKQKKEQKSEKKAGKTPFLTLDLSMHPHVIITTRAAYILRHD